MSGWHDVAAARDLPPGAVVPVDLAGGAWIVWRTRSGALGVMPRRCPHLDADLADAIVASDELVCRAHEWRFTVDGQARKRNVKGRVDSKDRVPVPAVREVAGRVELAPGAARDAPCPARGEPGR